LALKLQLDRTTAGRTTSALVLRGAQALADKTVKRSDADLTGWRAEIAGIVRGTLGDDQAESDAIDAAYYVRAAMEQEGIQAPGFNLKASSENAVRMVIGQPLDRGGGQDRSAARDVGVGLHRQTARLHPSGAEADGPLG
jgi:hypothetical protein